MVPHFIVNEELNLVLRFDRNYDNTTTTLSLLKPTADGFELIKEKQHDDLLNHAVSIGNHFLVATMKVRQWGAPAFIEEWDWQSLTLVKKHNIQGDKFGLMQFTASDDASTILIDRFWPPEQGSYGHSRIFSFPDFQELGRVKLDSNLLCPVFNASADKLLLVHTDQGGAEARLLVKQDGAFEEVNQFAMDEIPNDFAYTAIAFTSQGYLLLTHYIDSSLHLYDENTFDIKWETRIPGKYKQDVEDYCGKHNKSFDVDSLTTYLFNTNLNFYTDDENIYVGGTGKIYQLDLVSGNIKSNIDFDNLSLIVQIRKIK